MSVHYKFKSALEYDTVTFDGLHISVKDLKNSIVQQKRIGKNTDFDLQVTNAQTKEVYDDEHTLIPKNTSLLIARIPLAVQSKAKTWEGYGTDSTPTPRSDEGGPAAKAVDLSSLDASEDDKIRAMMSQSTQDYDPSNYMKIRGANQVGVVPQNYRCYKCHQIGHWIKDCPLGQGTEQIEIKKSTGIPRSFMVPVDGPQVQGAMMTPYGSYAVPALDHQTYTQKQGPAVVQPPVQKTDIPDDLVCTICSDLLTDAVMIPCCGNSFCDECIRSTLLESEEHECPDCHERDISPGTLIPNRFLRNSVANFKNTTGYVKRQIYKPAIQAAQQPTIIPEKEIKPDETEEEVKVEISKVDPAPESTEKTIISEADSTEAPKTPVSDGINKEEVVTKPAEEEEPAPELPPGVSPAREKTPEPVPIKVNTHHRERNHSQSSSRHSRDKAKDRSPRRSHKRRSSPHYREPVVEERPGTPTVDEPGVGGVNSDDGSYQSSNAPYPSVPPPVMPSSIAPPHHIQGPPPGMNQPPSNNYPPPVQQYPPSQNMMPHGPLPNFRLPPPGSNPPPNFIPGMYNVPPRPMFDPSRPPLQGPPPNFQNYSNRPRGRDFGPRNMRGRTPPGIIDDPLEAFNRMLREKDERERRAKQRKARSYSRSSSRSYSRSPRRRSRTPRRRSRSRSKSFTISRSRSRSYSPANRGSPYRDYSPRRRPPSRYRTSPQRSPSRYRYKDAPERTREREYDRERERDRDRDRDRERDRDRDREYNMPKRENMRGYSRDRNAEYHYYDNFERDKGGPPRGSKWSQPRDGFYPPQDHQPMGYHQPPGPPVPQHPVSNRYQRDQYPPNYKPDHIPPPLIPPLLPPRRYDDVAPPGTEQPLPPGEEPATRYDDRYNMYENRPRPEMQPIPEQHYNRDHEMYKENDKYVRDGTFHENRDREVQQERRTYNEKPPREERETRDKERRHDRYSRSPKHSKDNESPEKHKRKKKDETPERVKRDDKEKKRDHSDDEKSKKSKEKKKKRDKKETDKKKKKDKKEKREHKKEEKDKEKVKHEKDRKEESVPEQTQNGKEKEEEKQLVPDKKVVESPKSPKPIREVIMEDKDQAEEKQTRAKTESPKRAEEADLYGDILSEGIDNSIVESYGKIDESRTRSLSPVARNKSPISRSKSPISRNKSPSSRNKSPPARNKSPSSRNKSPVSRSKSPLARSKSPVPRNKSPDLNNPDGLEEGQLEPQETKEYEDVLELYTGELKSELDKEVLAPLPEKSKWELDEEPGQATEVQQEIKSEKSNKVTNEVLKRAENAIFAKAINAIRPIEIKKISLDRVKLYSGEKDEKKEDELKLEVEQVVEPPKVEAEPPKPVRLSVKERLGCKVDELDRIVRVERTYDRNRSRTLSPLAKRSQDIRNDRRVEIDDKRRERDRGHDRDRHHRGFRNTERRDDRRRDDRRDRERERHRTRDREVNNKDKDRKERSRSKNKKEDEKREKRKRSRSKSEEKKDKHKKREKKQKKEKPKRHHKKEDEVKEGTQADNKPETSDKPKQTTEKRKPTLDEANFVPDYDMESESDNDKLKEQKKRAETIVELEAPKKRAKVEEKQESSSSDSSSSSSEDEKKKKKHKKHRKKKRRESSSSSSDSDSSSSEDEKDRKKRKHKKKQKKKKKSKHK